MEELTQEVEHESSSLPYGGLFTKTGIGPIGPQPGGAQKPYKRRWHANRGDIMKSRPPTQKSGGTLDYVLARQDKGISVQICIDIDAYSDHAAILMDRPDW